MAWFDGITPRAVYIKHCQQLGCRKNANLLRTLSDSPDGFSRLTQLDATHNLIGRVGFKALLEVIRIAHDLQRLCLANNGLDDSSVLLLLPVVQNHQNLVYLDLSSNPLGRSCGAQVLQFVKDCPNVQWLLLEETLMLQSLLQTIERKLLENRQRANASMPDISEGSALPALPGTAQSGRGKPHVVNANVSGPSSSAVLPRDPVQLAIAYPRRTQRYIMQPIEPDPPDLVRQILADEGRWKNAARSLYLEADEAGIGSLTTIELGLVMQSVILKLGLMPPPTQEIAIVLDLMDSDRSGRLTENEFVHAVRSYLLRQAKSAEAAYQPRQAARRPAHVDRTPWRATGPRHPCIQDRPRAPEKPDVAGWGGNDGLLEELSAELYNTDQNLLEESGLLRWLDEAKGMGGVNSYMDREAVTLDDLDNRLTDQQYMRRSEDRPRVRDGQPGMEYVNPLDRRGRRRREDEGRAPDVPRRDERQERGQRDRSRASDAAARELERLQEAYQRLQEEQRRRQEQGNRQDDWNQRRNNFQSTGDEDYLRPGSHAADRSPEPVPRVNGPERNPGRQLEEPNPVPRPTPSEPAVSSHAAQNPRGSGGVTSDMLSQAEQLLANPASPTPGSGLGIRHLLSSAAGPTPFLQLLQDDPKGTDNQRANDPKQVGEVKPSIQNLLSAGGSSTPSLQYLGPKVRRR